MPTYLIQDKADLEQKFLEAVQIIDKMRRYKKVWDQHYGATNRENLKRWEEKADEFLARLPVKETETEPETNNPLK